ncbi:MAG: L-lactate dehydrogenase [Atopobiaceae bacterium]|nr:L-lactate dehydrogenase [Atopobiaceae bacterium]
MNLPGNKHKIVIIGAGFVGSQCAASLMTLGLVDEIVLLDVNAERARAQVMDLDDMASGIPQRIMVRTGDYDDCSDAEFVIIAAGRSRRPGQSRRDMLADTMVSLLPIAKNIRESGFSGVSISVTNPVDVVTECLYRQLELPRSQVFGTGTALDSARLRRLVSEYTGISRGQVQAFALGEHGESAFIWGSHIRLEGIPIPEYLSLGIQSDTSCLDLSYLTQRMRQRGTHIVAGKGRTEYGISTVVAGIVAAILHDEQIMMPLSVHLEGEYGESGISVSVPCIVGTGGAHTILEVQLTEEERAMLHASCEAIRGYAGKALDRL